MLFKGAFVSFQLFKEKKMSGELLKMVAQKKYFGSHKKEGKARVP
jgi:hypothetical protein